MHGVVLDSNAAHVRQTNPAAVSAETIHKKCVSEDTPIAYFGACLRENASVAQSDIRVCVRIRRQKRSKTSIFGVATTTRTNRRVARRRELRGGNFFLVRCRGYRCSFRNVSALSQLYVLERVTSLSSHSRDCTRKSDTRRSHVFYVAAVRGCQHCGNCAVGLDIAVYKS